MQLEQSLTKNSTPNYSDPSLLFNDGKALPPAPRPRFWSNPPHYDDLRIERLYRKQRMAGAMRMFHRHGFLWGIAGHITARDPEYSDHYWAHPWGTPFSNVTVSDLVLVDPEGTVVAGNYDASDPPLSGAAFSFHAGIYRERPDVMAVAHSHSPKATSWSAIGEPIEPVTQNSAVFFRRHAVFNEYDGLPFEEGHDHEVAEGKRIACALGDKNVILLQNHGAVSVGPSVDIATWLFIAFEDACRIQMDAEMFASRKKIMPNDLAEKTAQMIGSDACSFVCFNSLWQTLLKEEPDFLA